jgi:hypothetical protein
LAKIYPEEIALNRQGRSRDPKPRAADSNRSAWGTRRPMNGTLNEGPLWAYSVEELGSWRLASAAR